MHLFPRLKDLEHAFFQVDVDASAVRPFWWHALGNESLHTLGEANKTLVLETLWKRYQWKEVFEQPDESSRGEHLVFYRREGSADAERRVLVSSGKLLPLRGPGSNVYNTPFFREHLWDEDAPIQDESLWADLYRFTGVPPSNARRIADVVESLGPRLREIIRFTAVPVADRLARAESFFEYVWRFHSSLHESGVDFAIAISETDMSVMALYEALGKALGRPVILTVATADVLSHTTGRLKRTVLYFIATAPFRQLVPTLSVDELGQVIQACLRSRPGPK